MVFYAHFYGEGFNMKSKTYEEFIEKFKPKKTTNDCYTPPSVYAVIRDWACEEYGIDPTKIVRPFYPGGGTGQPAVFDSIKNLCVLP